MKKSRHIYRATRYNIKHNKEKIKIKMKMKSNVEDITNKVVYAKIYNALNYHDDFLFDNF